MTTETQPIQLHQTPGNTSLPSKLTPQLPVTPPSTPMWWDKPKSQVPSTSRPTRPTTSTPASDSIQDSPLQPSQTPKLETPSTWCSSSTVPRQLSLALALSPQQSLFPCSEEIWQDETLVLMTHEKRRLLLTHFSIVGDKEGPELESWDSKQQFQFKCLCG